MTSLLETRVTNAKDNYRKHSPQPTRRRNHRILPQPRRLPTIKHFHDWFSSPKGPNPGKSFNPFRPQLSDEAAIKFTYGDLHPSNIIVSSASDGSPKIISIIDWHQSGWYPDYWEYNKALWTAEIGVEWATEYVPRFIEGSTSDEAWNFLSGDDRLLNTLRSPE